jgi:sulfatase modifying factor 1
MRRAWRDAEASRSLHRTPVLASVLTASLSACQLIAGIEELPAEQRNAAGSGGSASDDGGAGDTQPCPSKEQAIGGPELTTVRQPDGTCFLIDETEVTAAQYQAFLDDEPSATSDSSCDWNVDFVPSCAADTPDHPVACVDFCDAAAFCAWAGKSLCPGDPFAPTDPDESTWYAACAGEQGEPFPYGRSREAARCNGFDNPSTGCEDGSCSLVTATMLTGCATEQGVLHLSGNVEEWALECKGASGATDPCLTRGGSAQSQVSSLACDTTSERSRDYRNAFTGFRCCVTE